MRRIISSITGICMTGATAWGAVDALRVSPHTLTLLSNAQKHETVAPIVDAYITLDNDCDDQALIEKIKDIGASVSLHIGRTLTARVPIESVTQISAMPGVKYVQAGTPAQKMLDVAGPEVNINKVHGGSDISAPLTGQGVVVGIVDNGFDYSHAAFTDGGGTLRIKRVWEQGTSPSGTLSSPEPFGFGTEMTDATDILNAGGDIRNNSHGTHVASIAAGSDDYLEGTLKGMAPEADIVLVSLDGGGANNVNITNAIAYIFSYAESVGKPCVVNLSLGAHSGPHDGTSTFDTLADALQGPGRLIVGSAGNHRADKFHINHTFTGSEGEEPLRTCIDFKTSMASAVGGTIEVWGQQDAEIEVALLAYKTTTGEVAERVVVYPAETSEAQTVSLGRNISGDIIAASNIDPVSHKPHVVLTSGIKSIRTGYVAAIEVTSNTASTVDIWADNTTLGLASGDIPGFAAPTNESTICEIGGTAKRILTVGAYTTRSKYTPLSDGVERTLEETDGSLSSFSSCGPTADGRIKPQVTAPGCFISAAVSQHDNSGTLIYSQYHNNNGHDNYYGFMQGTSMSSPLVAGIVATWLQAWPEMTPEDLQEVIAGTCRTDTHTGDLTIPDNDWGYGKIDALAGAKECIKRSSAGIDAVTTPSTEAIATIVSGASGTVTVTLLHDADNTVVDIYSTSGGHISSVRAVNAAALQQITVPVNARGIYVVKVTTDRGATTSKVIL